MISDEQKLAAIVAYFEENESSHQIAKRLQIDRHYIRVWIGLNCIDIMVSKELFVQKGVRVNGQKFYFSAVLDLFNREIVGYEVSKSPNFELIQQSFKKAFMYTKLPEKSDLIIHSDQGWLYQIPRFKELLATYEIKQSMSRKGNCLDNAVIESFFGIMKSEFLYTTTFKNHEEFTKALADYIYYYNHE